MATFTKRLAAAALVLVPALPIALIGTFVLTPLWSWIEARYGIESVGASGPANWCFVVTYVATAVVGLFLQWRARRVCKPPAE